MNYWTDAIAVPNAVQMAAAIADDRVSVYLGESITLKISVTAILHIHPLSFIVCKKKHLLLTVYLLSFTS